MKRHKLIVEIGGTIEDITIGKFMEAMKIIGKPLKDLRLEETHYTEPQVIRCPRCGSINTYRYGKRHDVQEYLCVECKRKFTNRDLPFGMRTSIDQVGASLDMYYKGNSLADVAGFLKTTYNNPVDRSTVYHWLIKFTKEAIKIFDDVHPKVGNVWIADETVIKFNGINHWAFDCIDRYSRFLLASYLSPNRGTKEAKFLMELASARANKIPDKVITDSLRAYLDGIELVFGADTKHIQSSPFSSVDSTNIIERFQATVKERTKVLWGFKTLESAKLILDGFLINYNYFRGHISLDGRTPASAAKVKAPVTNWTELVRKVGA